MEGARKRRIDIMTQSPIATMGGAPLSQAQPEETDARRQDSSLTNGLDLIGNSADMVDVTVSVCRAGADAFAPKFRTGGAETPARFATGGGDGAEGGFQTIADCAPVVDVAATTTEAAADGAGMLSDIAEGVGGLFDGLGSL
jgi:hypothetical protein